MIVNMTVGSYIYFVKLCQKEENAARTVNGTGKRGTSGSDTERV